MSSLVPGLIPRGQPLLGPTDIGVVEQVLSSDGMGGTFWADPASGGGDVTNPLTADLDADDFFTIINLPMPAAGGDAASADYVDAVIAGVLGSHIAATDPHTQYAKLTGRAGGQTIQGGTLASQTLTLQSTAHATKGSVTVGVGTVFDNKGRLSVNGSGASAGDTDIFKVEWPNSTGNSATKVRFINGATDVLTWSGAFGWAFNQEFAVAVVADPVAINAGGNYAAGTFTVRQSGADRFTIHQHLGSLIYGRATFGNGWTSFTCNAQVNINSTRLDFPSLAVRQVASQSANLVQFEDTAGTVFSAFKNNGAYQPASMADASAANGTLYYSTTANKLVFKDSGGAVNALY